MKMVLKIVQVVILIQIYYYTFLMYIYSEIGKMIKKYFQIELIFIKFAKY